MLATGESTRSGSYRSFDDASSLRAAESRTFDGLNYLHWTLPMYRPNHNTSSCVKCLYTFLFDIPVLRILRPVITYACVLYSFEIISNGLTLLGTPVLNDLLVSFPRSSMESYVFGSSGLSFILQPDAFKRRHLVAQLFADHKITENTACAYLAGSVLTTACVPFVMSLAFMISRIVFRSNHFVYNASYGILASLQMYLTLIPVSISLAFSSSITEQGQFVLALSDNWPYLLKNPVFSIEDWLLQQPLKLIEPTDTVSIRWLMGSAYLIAGITFSYVFSSRAITYLKYSIKGNVAKGLINTITVSPAAAICIGTFLPVLIQGSEMSTLLLSLLAFSRLIMIGKDHADSVETMFYLMLPALMVQSVMQLSLEADYLSNKNYFSDAFIHNYSGHNNTNHSKYSLSDHFSVGYAFNQAVTTAVIVSSLLVLSMLQRCCTANNMPMNLIKSLCSYPLSLSSKLSNCMDNLPPDSGDRTCGWFRNMETMPLVYCGCYCLLIPTVVFLFSLAAYSEGDHKKIIPDSNHTNTSGIIYAKF
jgi:hypothetical protein